MKIINIKSRIEELHGRMWIMERWIDGKRRCGIVEVATDEQLNGGRKLFAMRLRRDRRELRDAVTKYGKEQDHGKVTENLHHEEQPAG